IPGVPQPQQIPPPAPAPAPVPEVEGNADDFDEVNLEDMILAE
ncbi:unnamed protein product, partial [Allacma fusca]